MRPQFAQYVNSVEQELNSVLKEFFPDGKSEQITKAISRLIDAKLMAEADNSSRTWPYQAHSFGGFTYL